ncbi:MAG: radical SAM protein [Nitrospinaceae bacterium]|jgi:radical SAM superfamily enzyme YgiQ (UPF0313 family)|nr:radical SAM protein [Nitrospinaceae bacterium]|tara:strand:+ start:198 stop:1757 length:1560 start_codon:yes stop_codon:yes gene_type:complete
MIERILLVDIELDRNTSRQGLDYQASGNTHHPLGLMYLTSSVRQAYPATEIKILHTATCNDSEKELVGLLEQFQPQLVGVRSLSLFQSQLKHLSKIVRAKIPSAFLIGGGPYPSSSYSEIVGSHVDLVIIGEGEKTFVELIEKLNETKTLPTNLAGTAVWLDGQVKKNEGRPVVENLDELPPPDYNLINFNDYQGIFNLANQSTQTCAFIESSRGCTYKCYYCHAALSKTVRRRSAHLVIEEMAEHYHKRGLRDFVFVDDIFNVPKKIAKDILRRIIKNFHDITLNFSNGLRADQLDDEILDLFEEAGTVQMSLAFETATPRLQKLIVKHLNVSKAVEMTEKASRRFIVRTLSMVGFPTETLEEAEATIQLSKGLTYVAEPGLSIVRVYPGTPLFDALNPTPKEARLIEEQTSSALLTKLVDQPSFYGDYFPEEKVPIRGKDIQTIRWSWMRDIFHNKERIRNSHTVLEKHLKKDQILTFYRNLYQKPDFDEHSLKSWLNFASRDTRKTDGKKEPVTHH